jgi:hypothetical protein
MRPTSLKNRAIVLFGEYDEMLLREIKRIFKGISTKKMKILNGGQ